VKKLVLALGGLTVAATPSLASAQAVWECTIGQRVIDARGNPGVMVSGHGDECLIKYDGGQTQGWARWQTLSAAAPAKPAAPRVAPPGSAGPPPGNATAAVAILKPEVSNRLVYHADPRGHVLLTATTNGAPVRFMVDTGATLVVLNPDDARAAGIRRSDLVFNHTVQTANGPVHSAPVLLREIRIGELSIEKVQAAVIDSQGQSVLGMSFLGRLKGFEMRGRVLTIDW
jgi:clan AA aspartic protease (TIGR02281 family)